MKNIGLALSLLFVLPTLGVAQGIKFEKGTWSQSLEKAKSEGKIVFVDAYTTWCGPCKLLTRNTFPDPAVGEFFNRNFVNVKMDMEAGEGPAMAERYSVQVYPTLLFVDGSGRLLHRAAGYLLPKDLVELGRVALDTTQRFEALESRYHKLGDRSPEFLQQYLAALTTAYHPTTSQVANSYLATQSAHFADPKIMDLIVRYADDPYADAFRYLLAHRADFDKKYGAENVQSRIEGVFDNYSDQHPDLSLADREALVRALFGADAERRIAYQRLVHYRQAGDTEGFLRAASAYYAQYPSDDADELNEMAWVFFQNTSDKKHLQTALAWAEKSVSIFESYYNQDTVAHLYAKLGKKKKARQHAERALELARLSGADGTATQQLLDSLK
jgi:thiol-disulfide isomerase/thioredoxin